MGYHRGPSIVTEGLVVHLDAMSSRSYPGTGTTWFDLSGNGNNMNLINSPSHIGSKYFQFESSNSQRADAISEYSFTTGNGVDYTFELWFKMRSFPTTNYGDHGHIWGTENGNNVVIYMDYATAAGGRRGLMVYDDTRYNDALKTTGSFQLNTWAHWTITGDGTANTVSHYINGEPDRIDQLPHSDIYYVRGWNNTRIAYDTRWGTYTDLDLSVAKQYNRKLTASEVKQNYNALKGRFNLQ